VGGGRLEAFYHHIFTTDVDAIQTIQELGLGSKLLWLESKVGFFHQGTLYDFVTPWDLLRFSPVGLADRVRLGLVGLYLRWYKNWRSLEKYTAREWITRYAGKRNYEVICGPLLRGKFGESFDEVGMVWFWGKIHLRFPSRKGLRQREVLGYLEGSFGLLVDALAKAIRQRGGQIFPATPVNRIRVEEGRAVGLEANEAFHPFDAVVATVPSPIFLSLVPELPPSYASNLKEVRYQAAVCLVLALKRSLSRIYWLNISDPSSPFVAAIEHTNLIDRSHYGGKHILYLSNYFSPNSPLYEADQEELLSLYLPYLKNINPQFEPDWVEGSYLFRDKAGQPVITTHYSQRIPDYSTPIPGLYLANTTQIYPQDRGMNYSIRLGMEIARRVAANT
jgi:protoporphyrinogen oxidase